MKELFSIKYDNSPDEIETAYKAFQTRYALRRKLIYTVVYLIVIVLSVNLIITDPTGFAGYIAGGLSLGILIFNWIKPVLIRRKMMAAMRELGTDETYIMHFYDDRIEAETEIIPSDTPTETVAITTHGVFTVEEGSEAAKEIAENPGLISDETQIEKTIYRLAETEICMSELHDLLLVFVNRTYIHAIPKRCLGNAEILTFKSYFEDKGLI